MQIVAVGVSHTSAPVDVRERLAIPADALADVLTALRASAAEGFALSTCNRVELYAVCGHEASGADILRQILATHGGVPVQAVREASYAFGHYAAVRHALRVAAGLDSMVIGEDEILGQMRRAIEAARRAGTLGPMLDRLGTAALACGKIVRSSTALGRHAESVVSIALRVARRLHGPLDGARIVVVGAGHTATLALRYLSAHAAGRVTVVNRTLESGAALASTHGAAARPWAELPDAVAGADIVLVCTAADSAVLDAATLSTGRRLTRRPLLCVDLGVPRGVDRSIAEFPWVTLVDLDRLESDAAVHRTERAHDVMRAEEIVTGETERYMQWWRGRGVASTITRLHAHAAAIAQSELERALARLPDQPARQREVVAELARRIVGKLLHEPTLVLKRDAEGENMAAVVERLFALAGAKAAAPPAAAGAGAEPRHREETVAR